MIIPICSGILLGLSLIFDGYMENIFIIATTIIIYYYITNYKKQYKEIFIGLIISYFLVNIFSIIVLKDNINQNIVDYDEEVSIKRKQQSYFYMMEKIETMI